MLYTLEQVPVEQVIIKRCMREGLPLPDRIKNAPELHLGLELYFNAFFHLCSCRTVSMGVGEIPWTSIQQYCESLSLGEEETEDMHQYIRLMDQEYIKHMNKKSGG